MKFAKLETLCIQIMHGGEGQARPVADMFAVYIQVDVKISTGRPEGLLRVIVIHLLAVGKSFSSCKSANFPLNYLSNRARRSS